MPADIIGGLVASSYPKNLTARNWTAEAKCPEPNHYSGGINVRSNGIRRSTATSLASNSAA